MIVKFESGIMWYLIILPVMYNMYAVHLKSFNFREGDCRTTHPVKLTADFFS